MGHMARVSWATTSADDVEAVVGVLLCLENPEASRIKASRGDGGIDVLVPEPGAPRRIEVYQVKSFTGRMSASRRGQVERSLLRLISYCAQHDLEVTAWYLAVPITPTNETREWFLGLAAGHPFPCHWRGEDFLDVFPRMPKVLVPHDIYHEDWIRFTTVGPPRNTVVSLS